MNGTKRTVVRGRRKHLATPHKLLAIALAVLMVTAMLCGGAALAAGSAESDAAGGDRQRYIDEVGLLTGPEARELSGKLDEISERWQFDTVVAVVDSIGYKSARLFAADFYEQNGFGFGSGSDGIILLISMENRDFAFVTTGYGLKAFTDTRQERLEGMFLPYLRTNDYFGAFTAFADGVDDFLAQAGKDKGRYRLNAAIASIVLALIIALIVTGIWRSQLKSVGRQNLAQAYIRPGSMILTARRDIFLHRHVSKVARPKSTSSGGRGSFRSSSGSSFSGRSGRF